MAPRIQLKARVWRNDGSEGNDGYGPARTPYRAPPPAKPKAKARPAVKKAVKKAPKSKTVYQRLMGDDAF